MLEVVETEEESDSEVNKDDSDVDDDERVVCGTEEDDDRDKVDAEVANGGNVSADKEVDNLDVVAESGDIVGGVDNGDEEGDTDDVSGDDVGGDEVADDDDEVSA